MQRSELIEQIQLEQSLLCVGLDPDIALLPFGYEKNTSGIKSFLKTVIEASLPYAVAYKPNMAFFEVFGAQGWTLLEEILKMIPKNKFVIADAKRGDIGNTAKKYAEAFFEHLNVDAITINPYMGMDSVKPFLAYKNKWAIVLAATSNPSAGAIQDWQNESGTSVYEEVVRTCSSIGSEENLMYVVGATVTDKLRDIRGIAPNHFLLIPGIGAQGGNLEEVLKIGSTKEGGMLINVGRDILYPPPGKPVNSHVREKASYYQSIMATYLNAQ